MEMMKHAKVYFFLLAGKDNLVVHGAPIKSTYKLIFVSLATKYRKSTIASPVRSITSSRNCSKDSTAVAHLSLCKHKLKL